MKFRVMNAYGEYYTPQGGWSANESRAWELSPARALVIAREEHAALIAVPVVVEFVGAAA